MEEKALKRHRQRVLKVGRAAEAKARHHWVDTRLLARKLSEAELKLVERLETSNEDGSDTVGSQVHYGVPAHTMDHLQNKFIEGYSSSIKAEFGDNVRLRKAPLSYGVGEEFLDICISNNVELPLLGYHGTYHANFNSIFRRGLLVPSEANGVQVVHGSALGVGIYSTCSGNASVSKFYMHDTSDMLCCGILPSTCIPNIRRKMHQGGGVRVCYDERQIVPIAVATLSNSNEELASNSNEELAARWKQAPLIGTNNANKANSKWVGRHRRVIEDEVIWLPPKKEDWSHAKMIKRRISKRERCRSRQEARKNKRSILESG